MDKQDELRKKARGLLESKKVEQIIGYAKGSNSTRTTPKFVSDKNKTEELVWNSFCTNNLTSYLKGIKNKTAIVVKGCDSRALVEMLKAKQVERENLCIIGVCCDGIVDSGKLFQKIKFDPNRDEVKEDIENLFIHKNKISKKDVLLDKCLFCEYKIPVIFDTLIGKETKERIKDEFLDVKEIEKMSAEGKKKFWKGQFEKCIGCFACRNVCPICYCEKCVLESRDPELVSSDENDRWLFHLVRAYHTTGRCVDCGECERVCPVRIPLRKLYRKLQKDVKEVFGYSAGVDPEEKNVLMDFKIDEEP